MSRTKAFISILMFLILIALSGASVWAAPGGQEEAEISGVVTDIVIEVGEDGTSTVLVTLEDGQEVRLSLETAAGLGLLTENGEMINQTVEIPDPDDPNNTISGEVIDFVIGEDGTTVLVTLLVDEVEQEFSLSLDMAGGLGLLTENNAMIGETVEIDPNDVIEEDEEGEEGWHPVASALAQYFASLIPELDYDTIMGRHEEGFGFGVIAQACWMSYALKGDADLWGDILDAKKNHDFSSIELPDGETPTNWGQFKKAVLGSEKHKNLGAIMSGRAKPPDGTDSGDEDEDEDENQNELGATATEGKVKDKKGKGPGEDGPPGQNKDKAGGKPDTPPGKENKGGGKGGGKKK